MLFAGLRRGHVSLGGIPRQFAASGPEFDLARKAAVSARPMPRDGSITVGDLVGKLEYLTLACVNCGRAGRYRVRRLVDELGRDGKLTDWMWRITADCPRRNRGWLKFVTRCSAIIDEAAK
jgi:hypothetical protein